MVDSLFSDIRVSCSGVSSVDCKSANVHLTYDMSTDAAPTGCFGYISILTTRA